MMMQTPRPFHLPQSRRRAALAAPARTHGEDGYILLLVMFMLALLIIGMAVALPKMTTAIQRDKEKETFRRGMQYRRAIQLYFRKFQRYPPNIDALVKTNEIRFLRKKYLDPMTGKDDWKPIMFGQNKTPMAMGFFGQPLGGIGFGGNALAGVGPAGGNGIAGASSLGGSSLGSSSSFGNNSSNSSSLGNSSFGSSSFGGSSIGSSSFGGSSIGSSSPTGGAGGSIFSSNNSGTSTTGSSGTGSSGAVDANGNPVDPNSASAGAGPTFGGAGIIGVSPASPKLSLFVYKKKNHYNEWEFLYSQLSDQMNITSGNFGNIQPSQPGYGAPGTGFSGPGGATNPGTGTGTDNGAGTGTGTASPTQPPPTPPQQ